MMCNVNENDNENPNDNENENMIPKIIHYCWFGGNPLPKLAQRCIASWRKFLPDYEIWQWSEGALNENQNENVNVNQNENESQNQNKSQNENKKQNQNQNENENYLFDKKLSFDVNMIPYTAEAYRQKKFAFVSDYARFWILHHYGGLYFDTDVEVIRPIDDIIAQGNFMGFEVDPDGKNTPGRYAPRYCFGVNPGIGMGICKEHPFVSQMLELYGKLTFDGGEMNPWLKTIVAYTTEALVEEGLQNVKGIQQVGDITVYPHDYFAPIDVITGRLHITPNTRSIHRYMGSWDGDNVNVNENENEKQNETLRYENEKVIISLDYLKKRLRNALPEWVFYLNNKIKRRKYRIK